MLAVVAFVCMHHAISANKSVQTSHFTCAEYNTYLRRLKLVISTFDSDVAYNCPAIKSFPDPDFVSRFFQNGGQE